MTRRSAWVRFARSALAGVRRTPIRDVATSAHALVMLIGIEATIRWVRLPRLATLLGVRLDLSPVQRVAEPMKLDDLPPRHARSLRAAARVARHWPFGGGPCLRRSLMAARMMRDLDPAIRLGVADGGDRVLAHAWLEIDGAPLEQLGDFVPFQSDPSNDRAGLPG